MMVRPVLHCPHCPGTAEVESWRADELAQGRELTAELDEM